MPESAIRFETWSPPQIADPARMDVACFIGLIAERPGAPLSPALREDLMRTYRLPPSALDQPGRLRNRPVTLTSAQDFESLFEADARLERQAVVEGGTLPAALPGSGIEPVLHVVVDGIVHAIDLAPLPTTPAALAARVAGAGLGLEAGIGGLGGLRVGLPATRGPGTLAVIAAPHYGFPETRRARARAIPSVMGQAVRQFFAMGGRKAVVIPMGDPLPYDASRAERLGALVRLMGRGPAGPTAEAGEAERVLRADLPEPSAGPAERYGIGHAYGLDDTTFLLLPDLVELVSPPPALAVLPPEPEEPEAVFAECLPAAGETADAAASTFQAPETDALGLALWSLALERLVAMLRASLRDKLVIAGLPRFGAEVAPTAPRSAFLQIAEGWVRTAYSQAAPGGLMAPDAVLAGHLASATLLRGTWLSAAALPLARVRDVEARPGTTDLPACRIERGPRGFRLSGDRTASEQASWADGPVSRLMALLLRQARAMAEDMVFEPSSPALWGRIEGGLRSLLEAIRLDGALAGSGEGDSYTVRCDTTTTTAQDIAEGRLFAEVMFRPTVPVARIRVRLPLSGDPGHITGEGGPA